MPRYPGGLIRKTPVTPAGPLQNGAASGVWTLADAAYWTKQGLWPLAGNTLAVEDVFSTWLYTGTGAAQTITNGIDLAGKGGLVWIKSRSAATNNFLFDTTRGVNVEINSNTTEANATLANSLTAFNSNGFTVGSAAGISTNAATYASWTFRKAPKFFDVVTWTGNGVNGRQIPHSLGITPGCVIVKATSSTGNWIAQGNSMPNGVVLFNSSTVDIANAAQGYIGQRTATTFQVVGGYPDDTILSAVNATGVTYVAYLFAHDATADGVIQCGSYTGNGSATGPVVTLGWEPQWLMIKRVNDPSSGNWQIIDNMRGMPVGTAEATLQANLANAETDVEYVSPTATGFQVTSTNTQVNANGGGYFFIAIRRGPMKTPTLGTSVFSPVLYTGIGGTQNLTGSGFVSDATINKNRDTNNWSAATWADRLRGWYALQSSFTSAEIASTDYSVSGSSTNQTGLVAGPFANSLDKTWVAWNFRRAPNFFDVVCYTGTGASGLTINHSLGVAPELMIVKSRSSSYAWFTYSASLGATKYLILNTTNTATTSIRAWNNTAPNATQFTLGNFGDTNGSGDTYVAYLFASCPGVSKVGTYTGNGSSQTINCAFTTGARFVLIKRTDSTGDWYVWDSARGIVAGNDPYLALNNTNAEVTTNDSVDTDNTGFVVNQVAASNVNVNGATYIFLAIS